MTDESDRKSQHEATTGSWLGEGLGKDAWAGRRFQGRVSKWSAPIKAVLTISKQPFKNIATNNHCPELRNQSITVDGGLKGWIWGPTLIGPGGSGGPRRPRVHKRHTGAWGGSSSPPRKWCQPCAYENHPSSFQNTNAKGLSFRDTDFIGPGGPLQDLNSISNFPSDSHGQPGSGSGGRSDPSHGRGTPPRINWPGSGPFPVVDLLWDHRQSTWQVTVCIS